MLLALEMAIVQSMPSVFGTDCIRLTSCVAHRITGVSGDRMFGIVLGCISVVFSPTRSWIDAVHGYAIGAIDRYEHAALSAVFFLKLLTLDFNALPFTRP
ncbi:MAG TPA: hypothetical protein VMS43_10890 [Allosphingosinicella sp.]|nr:hypothetical protein [Allosphingosinicella sp.]